MRGLRLGLLGVCGLIQAVAAAAEPMRRKPLDISAFAEIPALEGPELSPAGRMIAAKVAAGGKQFFAIMPVNGGPPRYVGLGEYDLNWWQWVSDEWLVLGVGQLVPVEGSDWYVSRAVSVNAFTGKIINLSAPNAGQDADDLIWTANDGSPRILMASQTSIYRDDAGFYPGIDEINVSTGSMGDDKLYDEASKVTAKDGEVVLDGPVGVDVKVTPEAAEQTAINLEDAAVEARGQRYFQDLPQRSR